ncbi:MAG TPA: hypothetical protein VIL36_11790 [Acidimicrobiales bacterium]
MRNRRPHRGLVLAATLAVPVALGVTACSDDGSGAAGSAGDPGSRPIAGRASQGDTCELLDDAALATLFPDGVPEPAGTSMGEGFGECEWGEERDGTVVLVSTLPAGDFHTDYVDQLDVSAPVAGLGDGAVSFPGFVGLGRGSAGGGSVGFTKDDRAALVAVRTGGGPAADAALATELAATVADRL